MTFAALLTAFDEKSLFPKYLLDYENEMKRAAHQPQTQASVSFVAVHLFHKFIFDILMNYSMNP